MPKAEIEVKFILYSNVVLNTFMTISFLMEECNSLVFQKQGNM